eukprot:GFYU01001814.1.p2 GENE.GFYU01001814.1~~GFYU01001814.1.p2  ORF type:complete len:277 (-),score=105.05 GFYU01001814.1:110-940(-)
MNDLMRRLRVIEAECSPVDKGKGKEKLSSVDEFARTKKDLAFELKEIRQQIAERDELFAKQVKSAQVVALSQNIRNRIKAVKEEGEKLKDLQRKETNKKGKNALPGETLARREEQTDLVFKHIEEVEYLEKKRHTGGGGEKGAADRKALFAGGVAVARPKPPTETDLQDIDVTEGLKELQEMERAQDGILDDISRGVLNLKEQALVQQTELKKQHVMIDELDKDVDKAKAHLDNINTKMKSTLENIRKGRSFMVDFILLCFLLGLGGYIYNMVRNS